MTASNQYGLEGYKECVGKECHNLAIHRLEVLHIKKIGWFCDQCKDSLIESGLVAEIKDSSNNSTFP